MDSSETVAVASSQLRDYELVLIISPEVGEEVVNARIESLSKLVTSGEGVVSGVNQWGKKKLAYAVKHFWEGYYVLAQLKMKPATSKELEANLKIAEEVIRYLLVRMG